MSPNVASPDGPGSSKPRTSILLVEDEVFIRWMLSEELRDAGYQVVEACDAVEALSILQSCSPDLIISDVRMPGALDGLDLLAQVRKSTPDLPVIIMSGHLCPKQAIEAGATYFLEKPYILTLILDLVAEGLRKP